MNDLDYFALLLIKESKNKTMEIQIIMIIEVQVDFDMKPGIDNFYRKKLVLLFKVKYKNSRLIKDGILYNSNLVDSDFNHHDLLCLYHLMLHSKTVWIDQNRQYRIIFKIIQLRIIILEISMKYFLLWRIGVFILQNKW